MIIKRLKLEYFGKFQDKEIELLPGINLLYGENEAGKSTIHTFIRGMLFGIDRLRGRGSRSKEDIYSRYLPWDYPGAYGGQMDIFLEGKNYRIERSFLANDKRFTILDMDTGRELKLEEEDICQLIPGLTESTYRNTISSQQLRAETDAELANQVANYIANLSISKSREVNVDKAISSLKNQKKVLESTAYTSKLKELSVQIEEGEAREKEIEVLLEGLKELEALEKRLKEKRASYNNEKSQRLDNLMGQLPAILERFRTHQGLVSHHEELENQIGELNNKISSLKKFCKEFENKNNGCYGQDRYEPNQQQKENKTWSKGLLYIVISTIIVLLASYVTKSLLVGGMVLIPVLILAIILYNSNKKNHQLVLSEQIRGQEEYLKATVTLENSREHLSKLLDRRKQLEDDIDELHDTIMIYMQNFIIEDQLTVEAVGRLKECINNKKEIMARNEEDLDSQIRDCQRNIYNIEMKLSALEDNERELIKNKDLYADIMQKQEENKNEIEAINLALNTINELAINIHDDFGVQLNHGVSDIIGKVTSGRYRDLKIDEKLNMKLVWNDKLIMLNNLSAGTIDQLYFSLRLTVADLLLGKDSMPLIFDDSFALYDNKRVKAALAQIASRSQVIIFTCQSREKKFLEELGLSYNYIKL